MTLEGTIRHGMSLSTECVSDVMVIAFGPIGSFVDLSKYYTKKEIDDKGYLTEHQDISGKADSAGLASVATSGSYNDLSNKPTIPTVPTNVSAFNNDAGYIKQQSLTNYYTKSEVNSAIVDSNPVIEISPTSNARVFAGTAPFSKLVDKQRVTFLFNSVSALEMSLKLTLSGGFETAAIPMYVITYAPANGQRYITKLTTGQITAGQHQEFMYDATNNRLVGGVIDSNTTYGALSQNELTTGTATSNKTITAKLLRDNFYLKTEIDATIGDIETLLASI